MNLPRATSVVVVVRGVLPEKLAELAECTLGGAAESLAIPLDIKA